VEKKNLPELMIVLLHKKTSKYKYNGPFTDKSIL